MELKLATAEKEVLEELVKLVQSRGLRGENGGWNDFVDAYDKMFGASTSDPSKRPHDDLVSFLTTFKNTQALQILRCHANHLLIEKFKQKSPDNDTPEQSLIRLTVEHPKYQRDYSFQPYSKVLFPLLNHCNPPSDSFEIAKQDWFVSDVGMNKWKVMRTSQMVAVDCEMVLCEDGTEGLVRVCAVDRNFKVILDKFVKPDKPVVDYRTLITGVTAEDIEKATLSVLDIQKQLQPFLSRGVILVGHSLNKDLEVLKIDHPKVIDTSLVFKYSTTRKRERPSLNNLCKSILGYEVRKAGLPHDCVHDAVGTMKLALALIEKRVDTTISPSEEMLEFDKSRLFLHKIPHRVPHEELNRLLSGAFTLEIKPARTQGGYYCAIVVLGSSEEADQAFENVDTNQMKDSLGLPHKLIFFKMSSGSRASLYVRKMVQDE